MKLTLKQLTDKGACKEQVKLFHTLFGDSVDVTEKLCASLAGKFDFDWAAINLLTPSTRADYERVAWADYERVAWAEYERVAWAEYKRATAAAWAEYKRATKAAWAEYERVARAEYKRATEAAWAEYKRATAVAFANAYNSQVQG